LEYAYWLFFIFIENNLVDDHSWSAITERLGARPVFDLHPFKYRQRCYSVLLYGKEEFGLSVIGRIFILIGSILVLAGTMGLFYKKDFMEKLHILSISDTIGILFFLIGMLFISRYSLKMILLLIVFLITAPMNTHVMARAFFLRSRKK
jgi:multicomponent Na+:H+ antiporter subunit G